jgi:hypothetical protein
MPEMDPAVHGDDATDARAEDQSDHRRRAAAGPEAQLGQAERAAVIDERDRQTEGSRNRSDDRTSGPVVRHVDEETGRPGDRVVQPQRPIPTVLMSGQRATADAPISAIRPMTASGAVRGTRRDLPAVERRPRPRVRRSPRARPLRVRDAEVDPEMAAHDSPVTRVRGPPRRR